MSDTATIQVDVYDGTRQLFSSEPDILIRIIDGNQQQVRVYDANGPSVRFPDLTYYDNLRDNYTAIAYSDGYSQAGFNPVHISPDVPQVVALMLLPKQFSFNFNAAKWETLAQTHPQLQKLLAHGAADDQAAQSRYYQLMETQSPTLAALLNITTAMSTISLPSGTPMDYFKELIWDNMMQQDRFYAYADRALVAQVKLAASQGEFAPEVGTGLLHPGATSSYKQVQFGEANVQLTFHENDTRVIDGVECVVVEPDIDYYKDPLAHALLEVLPNIFTGGKTNPLSVYALRWIAGRHAGVPEFDPPYTVESAA